MNPDIFRMKKSGILLIGLETKEEGANTSNFLLNPLDYTIKETDIGYVVAYDSNSARAITNLTTSSPHYAAYQKNMNFFKRMKLDQQTNTLITTVSQNIKKNLLEWEINHSAYFKKIKDVKESEHRKMKLPVIFDLRIKNSPKGVFRNHIVIKGPLNRLPRIAEVIRTYGERPILLFSEKEPNQSDWHKIKHSFKNVFYIIGCPTNVKHVVQLDPQKAFKILILSENYNNFIQDSESIVFTRIISDVLELNNFLTELIDENNLKYLSINPKYPNLDYYFWPFFVRGSVHFSSFAMSIVAKTLINRKWLNFIQNFAQLNIDPEEKITTNDQIHTMILSLEAAQEFQLFGYLQFALMNSKPPTIAIAVLKSKRKENAKIGEILGTRPRRSTAVQDNVISTEISRIMDNFYGSEFLMTNPCFLMPLEEGDKVLIIGDMSKEEKGIRNMNCDSPSKKKTKKRLRDEKLEVEIKDTNQFKKELGSVIDEVNETMKLIVNNWDDVKEKLKKKIKN